MKKYWWIWVVALAALVLLAAMVYKRWQRKASEPPNNTEDPGAPTPQDSTPEQTNTQEAVFIELMPELAWPTP